MLGSEPVQPVATERWPEVEPYHLGVAGVRLWTNRGFHDVVQPVVQELAHHLAFDRDGQPLLLVAERDLELLGDLPPGLAVDRLALALAVDVAEVDRGHPLPVALALVDAAFAVPAPRAHLAAPPSCVADRC